MGSFGEELERFRESFLYEPEAFFVDEILCLEREAHRLEARLHTTREFPIARYQRLAPDYPRHLSAGELVHLTACVGSLHGWFFHGLRWRDGWVGFGNRIHRADFQSIARVGPPLDLRSTDRLIRRGKRRLILRYEFSFSQEGKPVYHGDQTAIFLHRKATVS